MNISAQNSGRDDHPGNVSLRCPSCKLQGSFHPFPGVSDIGGQAASYGHVLLGQRRCPNPSCNSHVFVVHRSSEVIVSYPAEQLDFDSTNLPAGVTSALAEAITCHSNQCYVAAAIMVRKTLEELCRDRGAAGKNLKDRLTALASVVVLPADLLNSLDDLRMLGNDAAHIESQEYERVGKEEVEVGILLSKEVLKAVYQYSSLLGRLKALKKKPAL